MIRAWMEREELLFRTLERHLLGERLSQGFLTVDEFVEVSLSVQNRRKSRAGSALKIISKQFSCSLTFIFKREADGESLKTRFYLPGITQYHMPEFNVDGLTMLGANHPAKTAGGRFLSEAKRIPQKHLFTLEPGISEISDFRDARPSSSACDTAELAFNVFG